MLLVNVGIIVTAYVGARLFEHRREKKSFTQTMSTQPLQKTPDSHQLEEVVKDNNIERQPLKPESVQEDTDHGIDKAYDHHFKVSVAAMGLSAICYIYPPVTLLSIGVIVYTTFPILKQAEKSMLAERRIKNDLFTSLVSIMSLAMGQYFVAALEAWLYHFGDKMRHKSQDTSTQMLTNVFEQQPSKVWVVKDLQEIEVSLESLQVNDIVVVKAGDIVPIDGTITDGIAMIDQHALTGEAMPAEKGIGEQVFAATIVVSGSVYIKVDKTGLETTVAKLGEILSHTTEFKMKLQLKGEKWADKMATPLLSASFLSLPILGASSATALLNSAPTNAIRIFPSIQTFNHLTLVSNKGILVKDGRALEALTKIDTVLFDKTGTLTTGQPEVGQIIVCDELGEDEILTYAAAAEHRLTHPIARAIYQQAEERHLNLPDIEAANYKIGYGVTVSLNNQIIKVGSARFMTMEGIALPSIIEEASNRSQQEGYSLVMVAINEQLKGAIEMQPQLRPEADDIIKGLRQRGIQQISIVSGDHKHPTQKLAQTLGMDNYFSEVLPQDKASLVEQLQKEGRKVCFVGDGINDAIAMKKANVSISLRGASSIATDMAQVVLMDGSLSHLCDIFDISKQLNANLQHSLLFWAGYGIVSITAISLLRVGIMKSTIIYGMAFGLNMGHAMLPLRKMECKNK